MSQLQLLFDNMLDKITINDFLSPDEIQSFLKALYQQPEWKTADIAKEHDHLFAKKAKPMQLFSSQYMVISHGINEEQYLSQCQIYHNVWQTIVNECGFDPFKKVVEYLKTQYDIAIAVASKQNLHYCPAVVRDLAEEVLPHADFGPYDGPGWIINQVQKQIAWNLYLTHPGEGGDTLIYDYIWQNESVDEHSYGIENLDKPIKTKFSITPGKLILFNCRNFHAILKSSQPRIAIGGLFGETVNKQYIAWS